MSSRWPGSAQSERIFSSTNGIRKFVVRPGAGFGFACSFMEKGPNRKVRLGHLGDFTIYFSRVFVRSGSVTFGLRLSDGDHVDDDSEDCFRNYVGDRIPDLDCCSGTAAGETDHREDEYDRVEGP